MSRWANRLRDVAEVGASLPAAKQARSHAIPEKKQRTGCVWESVG
jgi:hypothetical protein